MSKILDDIEEIRIRLGLTQRAVALRIGIGQPHYSKVIGRAVALPDDLARRMTEWTKDQTLPTRTSKKDREVLELTRSIERQCRRLSAVLAQQGRAPARRHVSKTRARAGGVKRSS